MTHRKAKLLLVLAVALLQLLDLRLEGGHCRVEVGGFVELLLQRVDLLAILLTKLVLTIFVRELQASVKSDDGNPRLTC